jgi:FkbM family methyltransferase
MIRLQAAGTGRPSRHLRLLADAAGWLARIWGIEVVLPTAKGELHLRCPNALTLRRAYTLYVKEAGTISWLDGALRPDDIFLDVGANVGIYSLYAAQRIGQRGHVYAVEPHLRNAVALIDNIAVNGFTDRITVLTCALAERPRTARFQYDEWLPGSSGSQLADTISENAEARLAAPGISELKIAQSIDALVGQGAIPSPKVVKIDVDGLEPLILAGMQTTLTSASRPRTLQVECTPSNAGQIEAILRGCGYVLKERHASRSGEARLAAGQQMLEIVHNAVFIAA